MSPTEFRSLIADITKRIVDIPIDSLLEERLNHDFPASGPIFGAIADACRRGVSEGWLADREAGGIKYGRAFKALPETHGFSVDVVEMTDIAGPHHVHPNGEID